jgi:hypothetical protein
MNFENNYGKMFYNRGVESSFPERLTAVIAAKGASTKY